MVLSAEHISVQFQHKRSFTRKWYLVTCSWGDLAAASCLKPSCFKGWRELSHLWPFWSSAFVNNCCFLLLSAATNDFTRVQQTQTSQRRSLPRMRGEGSPHIKRMVPDPSSALHPVLLMLSKKLIVVKSHISASLLIPFASPHHLS